MIDQLRPQYLGMANMYALPSAVGGVDFPGQASWRRPTDDDVQQKSLGPAFQTKLIQAPAAKVNLTDFVTMTSQHILGQFRRIWSFLPSALNLWFRSEINLGASMRVSTPMSEDKVCDSLEEDAASAAADLYKLMQTGTYTDSRGRRKKINNDSTKLMYADGALPAVVVSSVRLYTTNMCGHLR